MRIAVYLAQDDALARRAIRRGSRAVFLAACSAAAACALGAVLLLWDARTVVARNAFLAEKAAKLEADRRDAAGDEPWKAVREKGAFFSAGLRAGGPGVVEALGVLEAALPEGVVVRQLQLSRGGALFVEGASKTLGGGERFRDRLAESGARWKFALENTGYDQSRREYGFRLKGGAGPR